MRINGKIAPEYQEILTSEALAFIEELEREFGQRRRELLQKRAERQKAFDAGTLPEFQSETAKIRASEFCPSMRAEATR